MTTHPPQPTRTAHRQMRSTARRRWTGFAVPLVLAAALAGCTATATVATFSTDTYLTITDGGAGAITSDTTYSSASLEAALPGTTFQPIQTAVESRTVSTLAGFADGVQVVQVFRGPNGNVSEIHGVTHHLAGPNGERIGMSMREAGVRRTDCRVGRDLWRGMAVCPARGADHVSLVFAIPGYQGPFDALPPEKDLARAELQRIVWRADAA